MKNDQPFNILIGRDLSSVEFVRDYIQIRFDGPCLTAITDPFILVENKRYSRSDVGFCDMLLSFIGLQVEKAFVEENELIYIQFSGSRSINVSLKPEDYIVVEAAIFDLNDRSGESWVW
jgi:hypothetical protein